jgi:hypothetical protein
MLRRLLKAWSNSGASPQVRAVDGVHVRECDGDFLGLSGGHERFECFADGAWMK